MATVRIRDELRDGRVREEGVLLVELPDRVSVRDLIRTRVREEVARANAAAAGPQRLLVEPVAAEEAINGYGLRAKRRIDWERQAEIAVEAFRKQAFFVFVDGTQVDELDDEVTVGADTDVRFVRLMPLVGG